MITTDLTHSYEIGDWQSVLNQIGQPDLSCTDGETLLLWGIAISQRGAAKQTIGEQETAKNCLTRAMQFLDGERKELAQVYLSLCYWRTGDHDDANALLEGIYTSVQGKFCAGLTKAIIAVESGDPATSLQLLQGIERLTSHVSEVSQGKLHNQLGFALWKLAALENDRELHSRSILEFEAAIYFWREVPSLRCIALNNLARMYSQAGKPQLALEYVDRAISLSASDKGLRAKFTDQKARILLDAGKTADAFAEARKALSLVAGGEQRAIIDECLDTLTQCTPDAFRTLPRRMDRQMLAERSRDFELADVLTKSNDGETAIELIELLARTADRNRVRPILKHLVMLTDEFDDFFEGFMSRFEPEPEAEEVGERAS